MENWISAAELSERMSRVRGAMATQGFEALVVFSPANVHYLVGHHSIDSWEFRALLIGKRGEPVLLLFDFERARFEMSGLGADAVYYGPGEDHLRRLAEVFETCAVSSGKVGIEQNSVHMGIDAMQSLRQSFPGVEWCAADRVVDELRAVKSTAEIDCIRRAAELTLAGMRTASDAIEPGVKDHEIVAAAADAMFRAGSHQLVMQPTVAVGPRSGAAHSQHNGLTVNPGDTVFVELSGNYRHYSAPLMRTTRVGGLTDDDRRYMEVARSVADLIVERARPGVAACDVAEAATSLVASIAQEVQYHYVFGYSVGISFPPHWLEESRFYLHATNPRPLRAGMVFHLPLTFRVIHECAVGMSRTILIDDERTEVLTEWPD